MLVSSYIYGVFHKEKTGDRTHREESLQNRARSDHFNSQVPQEKYESGNVDMATEDYCNVKVDDNL